MAPSTRLHLRFAVATALVIATAGGALLWYVRHQEVGQAEQTVTNHALDIERSILRDELTTADFAGPAHGARLAQLDRLFRDRVLGFGGLRVKIYRAPDGLVTYSNEHSLIGTTADDPVEFNTVLRGRTVRDVSTLNKEGGTGRDVKALEVYVPLELRHGRKPFGVFELYESYAPVAHAVRSFVIPFGVLLLLALLGMWATLFPLVQRMVRSLERDRAARHSAERALLEASEQLRQSQKMEAIGRLAGGVAHDFNNLLLAINGYSEFLVSDETLDARQRKFAAEIQGAGNRAAALTQQLLAFSRRQVLQPQVLDLNASLRDLESMLRPVIGAGVSIRLELDPDLRHVEADPSQVGQVVLNLAVNARDAMNGAGALTISTRNDGGDVVLEIGDTGVGMDEATQTRIFEPFFTTKDVGQGTGLGLSTVYGIVAQSGGTIDVASRPGHGATFAIRLPASDGTAAIAVAAEPPPERGGERILVVDDEKVVRELLAQMLRQQGYEVAVAGSAREARALGGHWDLLVTDVVMPETDGVTLAAELDSDHVLFISGYDQEALVAADASFLQKPFGGDTLAHAVRDLLDSAALVRSAA